MNTGSSGKVRVAIIGAGAVSDYHHVPAIKLDPRAELAGACDTDPALLEQRKGRLGHRLRHDRPRGDLLRPEGRRRDHRHAQLHPQADHPGRRQARQARHVREAAGREQRGSPGDVRGRPRRRRRPHDGLHLSVRPVDEIPPAPAQVGGTGHAAAFPVAAVPRLARDELGLAAVQGTGGSRRPLRHDDPPDRLRPRPARPAQERLRGRRPVRPPRPDSRRQALQALGGRRLVEPDRRV